MFEEKKAAFVVAGDPVEVSARWKLEFDGVSLEPVGEPTLRVKVGRKILTEAEAADRFGDNAFRKLIQQVRG